MMPVRGPVTIELLNRRRGLTQRLRTKFVLLVLALASTVGIALTSVPAAQASAVKSTGGSVLPASAQPHGTSLTAMLSRIALFQSSLSTASPLTPPETPFQILYSPASSSTFTVQAGTFLYVPVFYFDDTPTVVGCPPNVVVDAPGCVGIWPDNNAEARSYFFDPSKNDAHDMTITVDNVTTALGPDYVAGPVTTPPLLDGTPPGTHMINLAAFVSPLSPGTHTVTIAGVVDGPYLTISGASGFTFTASYTVVCLRG